MLKPNFFTKTKELTRHNLEFELHQKGYNEYDLARYYITGFKKFNEMIKSDLRTDDLNNSLIVRIQNNKMIISDFGYKIGMNIYNYLLEKHYNGDPTKFINVLHQIRCDFNLDNLNALPKTQRSKIIEPVKYNEIIKDSSLPVKIEVKRKRINNKLVWTDKDIAYWDSYGIPISKVEEKGIAPLEKFWITNFNKDGLPRMYNVKEELCYVYPFFKNSEGLFMYKIYMPLGYKENMDFRWVSNVNKKVIQNLKFIPKSGDLLIIQSSYKDIMLMETLQSGLNIIAPNGEGIWFDDNVWLDLRKNWKKIVLFANNDFDKKDNPGKVFAERHSSLYNIPYVCTPDGTASDISDFYKNYGEIETKQFLKETLHRINLL